MDLSKLPRLSKTPVSPMADEPPAAGAGPGPLPTTATAPGRRGAFCDRCGAALRPGARFCDSCGTPVTGTPPVPDYSSDRELGDTGGGAFEAWISIGIGVLLLFLAPTALKWASSKVFHTTFAPYADPITNQPVDYILMNDGSKINYRDQVTFWSDWSVTAFALALILEGAVLIFARRPLVVLIALIVTVAATLANLVYLVATYKTYGLALLSAMAVIFGVFIAAYEWRLLMMLVHAQRRSRAST